MNGLTAEAKKVLKRWSASDWYVYIRPLSSKYHDPQAPEQVYWAVSVDCRVMKGNGALTSFRGEGYDISEVITKLALEVPRRGKGYVAERPAYNGWLVPEAELKRQQAIAAKKTKKKGRRGSKD